MDRESKFLEIDVGRNRNEDFFFWGYLQEGV